MSVSLVFHHLFEGVRLVVNRELIHKRRARFIHADDFNMRAFTPELEDNLIERGYGRDIPEVRRADIDVHRFHRFLEVERGIEVLGRREKTWPLT